MKAYHTDRSVIFLFLFCLALFSPYPSSSIHTVHLLLLQILHIDA